MPRRSGRRHVNVFWFVVGEGAGVNAKASRLQMPETDFYSLTYELAHSARLDSLYLLCMFGALTRGLTDKEVQNLNHLFDRFMY